MLDERDSSGMPEHSNRIRVLLILVAATAIVSLLYAVQYYAGGPIHLSVITPITDLALSPDKSQIAAGAQDGGIYIWDVPAQIQTSISSKFDVTKAPPWPKHMLRDYNSSVIKVAYTPDGGTLVSVSQDGQVLLWDVASGQVKQRFSVGSGSLNGASLTPDCNWLATIGQDGVVRVSNVVTGQAVQSIGPGQGTKLVVAISSDGTRVAAGDGNNIQVWDAQTGQTIKMLQGYWDDPATQQTWMGHTKAVTAVAFSPDGTLLASGSADTTIIFWDLASGKVKWPSEGAWATVTGLFFSTEGDQALSTSKDNKARTMRVTGGKTTGTYEGHLSAVTAAAFGPQTDTIVTAGDDGTLRVWETANQKVVHLEWARVGLQVTWGKTLALWLLVSGLLSLVIAWWLSKLRMSGHLFGLGMYMLGPAVVLGLPIFEVISYPLNAASKLQIGWPLVVLGAWYIVLLVALTREPVARLYEAPQAVPLAQALVTSRRTAKARFGIYTFAVWLAILVLLFSVLRRFNLDIAFMGHFLNFIMLGSGITFYVSALSIILAVILALLGALGRLSANPITDGVSGFYISLIRGTPLLVQIYIWYLGLARLGIVLDPRLAGILALGVNYGAYMTEIFRAGIQAIGKGQHEAAQALGMSSSQTFRRIILPQAFRIVIPPIGNEFIAMMKDSSLVSVITVQELTWRASKIGRQNFRNMETFIIAAAFYWILTMIFQFLQGKLEEHMARGERR
jgi:polar amino acid transport system permease protein